VTIESKGDQIVVVDANCIVRGAWFLDTAAWHVLLYQSRMDLKQVVVPEVVVREVVGRFTEDLRASKKQVVDSGRTLDEFLRWSGGFPGRAKADDLDVGEWVRGYETELRRVLEEASVSVPPIPQIDLDDFVHRAIYRHRPFNGAGSGFRDCLIWMGFQFVVEAQPGIEGVLISADHKAFWDSGNTGLHPDLVSELEGRGVASPVTLYESVADFVKAQQIGDANIVAGVLRKVTETQDQLREWVSSALVGPSLTSDGVLRIEAVVKEVSGATVIFQSVSGVTGDGSELLLVNFLVKASTVIAWWFDATTVVEELDSRIFTSATATFDLDTGAFADFNLDAPTVAGCPELSSRLGVVGQPFFTYYQDLLKNLPPMLDYSEILKNLPPMLDYSEILKNLPPTPYYSEILKNLPPTPYYSEILKNLPPTPDYSEILKNLPPIQDYYSELFKNLTPMPDYSELFKNLTPLLGQLGSPKEDEAHAGSDEEGPLGEGEDGERTEGTPEPGDE
jgi:hypothetical protein